MKPNEVDKLPKIKAFKNETDPETKVTLTRLDQDTNLKVNDKSEDASLM